MPNLLALLLGGNNLAASRTTSLLIRCDNLLGTGTRTLSYTAYLELLEEDLEDDFFGENRDVKRLYTSDMVGRLSGLEIGSSGAEYDADYFYAAATGRLERVTGPGLPSSGTDPGATYSYVANTHLVDKVEFVNSGSAIAEADYSYESERPLLTTVENKWLSGPTTISKYAYVNDGLGRRTSCVRTGRAFSGDHFDLWSYNDRNELTGSNRYDGTDISVQTYPDTDEDHAYVYDPIGNRTEYEKGDDDPTLDYTTNALNQYYDVRVDDSTSAQGMIYDKDGNLVEQYATGDVDRDGDIDLADQQALLSSYNKCEGDAGYVAGADFNGDDCVDLADLQILGGVYGQSPDVVSLKLTWDAENRLIEYEPQLPEAGSQKVTFKYDYLSRRVEKQVFDWDDPNSVWESDASLHRRFVWYNWLMIEELDVDPNGVITPLRKYTWGKDLSGSLEGAGGIGGLLATYDTNATSSTGDDKSYLFFYDANGNVGQLVDASDGSVDAKYAYDPYGNATSSGDYADENPLRFSTKYWDDETGFGYWGIRYFDGVRWISRDPIGEEGGWNLYAYVGGCPISFTDALGEKVDGCCGPSITGHLHELLKEMKANFRDLPPEDQCAVCFGFRGMDGWDIGELHLAGREGGFAPFNQPGCGTGRCGGTVAVNGACYRAAEVNYLLWGAAHAMCRDAWFDWPKKIVKSSDGGKIYGYRLPCGRVTECNPFDCAGACESVRTWRFFAGPFGGKPNFCGAGTTDCRIAWAQSGYNDILTVADDCKEKDCLLGGCCGSYKGCLGGHLSYGQKSLMAHDQAAAFSGFSPSTKRMPARTSGSSLAPFSVRQLRAALSHSLNTIAKHAARLPLPFVRR